MTLLDVFIFQGRTLYYSILIEFIPKSIPARGKMLWGTNSLYFLTCPVNLDA